MKKYSYTGNKKEIVFDKKTYTVRQIESLVDMPEQNVRIGDVGGWIEHDYNLSQTGTAWIESGEAFGRTKITEDVYISESQIKDSFLSDTVTVVNSRISNSVVWGRAKVRDSNLSHTQVNYVLDREAKEQIYPNPKTELFCSELFYCDVLGDVLIHDSFLCLAQIDGVKLLSGRNHKEFSLYVKECNFKVDFRKLDNLKDKLIRLANEDTTLSIEKTFFDVEQCDFEETIVIIGSGYVRNLTSTKIEYLSLLGELAVEHLQLNNSSLVLNYFLKSISKIQGINKENPVIIQDSECKLNNTRLIGSIYIKGYIEADYLKMKDMSKIIVKNKVYPELKSVSLSDTAELKIESDKIIEKICLVEDEMLTL